MMVTAAHATSRYRNLAKNKVAWWPTKSVSVPWAQVNFENFLMLYLYDGGPTQHAVKRDQSNGG